MIHFYGMIIEDLEITMTNEAKADYYSNLFHEVKSAAAYWRLLNKTSGTTKVKRQTH